MEDERPPGVDEAEEGVAADAATEAGAGQLPTATAGGDYSYAGWGYTSGYDAHQQQQVTDYGGWAGAAGTSL